MTTLNIEQLQNKIDELTVTIGKDRLKLVTLSDKIQQNIQTKKDLEEELNTRKYAHLNFNNVPWNELLLVDDGGNSNKELKRHINNMMEGLPGVSCSSYNVQSLQSVLAIYLNHNLITPHYCQLLERVIDTILPHITPVAMDRHKQTPSAKILRIIDPDCGEHGTYSLAFTDKWSIRINNKPYGQPLNTTKELVQYITQYLAHGKEE